MNNIKHIFFDLDHTLWDFEKNSELTFERIFHEEKIALSLNDFLEVYAPTNLIYWKKFRMNEISKEDLRYYRLKEVFDKLNFKATDDLIHLIAHRYIEILGTQPHLFEGCVELLEYLNPKYSLHIITNGFKDVQRNKLTNSGIAHFFDTVTTSEDIHVKKPDPKIFSFAMKQANAISNESLMIGDNIEADIEGALAIGMKAILFGEQETYSGIRVNNLLDLKLYI